MSKEETVAKQHQALGMFADKFEQMCQAMRICIIGVISRNFKYKPEHQKHLWILLAGMMAYELESKLRALCSEIYTDESERKHLLKLFKRIQKIYQERNAIFHSTMYIGWFSEDDPHKSYFDSYNPKQSGTGLDDKHRELDVDELNKLADEAFALEELLMRLNGCIVFNHDIFENVKP